VSRSLRRSDDPLTAIALGMARRRMETETMSQIEDINPCVHIHREADRLADELRAAGWPVTGVSRSANRIGGCSAYIAIAGRPRLRISDHYSSTIVDALDIAPSTTAQRVAEIYAAVDASRAEAATARLDAEAAETLEERRLAIMLERYPQFCADKAARREVRRRWLGAQ